MAGRLAALTGLPANAYWGRLMVVGAEGCPKPTRVSVLQLIQCNPYVLASVLLFSWQWCVHLQNWCSRTLALQLDTLSRLCLMPGPPSD